MRVPDEITKVDGCNCGGFDLHRADCSIFDLPHDRAQAAVDEAHERLQAWTDELNRRLQLAPAGEQP
jgi:hypothetical protein